MLLHSLCKNTQKLSEKQIFYRESTKKVWFLLIFSGLLVLLHYLMHGSV